MRLTSMITKTIFGVLSASALVACGNEGSVPIVGEGINVSDGINVSEGVEMRKTMQNPDLQNKKCYVEKGDGVKLSTKPPVDSKVYLIKIESSGAIRRYLPADRPGQRPLLSQINEAIVRNDTAAVVRLLGTAQLAELSPAPTVGIPSGKTPLYSKIKYHSRLFYVLLNENLEFVEDKQSPFEPINLVGPDFRAPYYQPANYVNRTGTHDVLTMDFYAPKKYVTKQDCKYSYNLNVYAKTPVGEGMLKTLLVVDPEHENQGGDSGNRG